MVSKARDWRIALFALSAIWILLDRITKNWVTEHIVIGNSIPIIPHVFSISHVLNSGAAFSLFADSISPERVRLMLIAFSVLAALVVVVLLLKLGRQLTLTTLALALILGGAIGNLYDRVRFASVVDFLEVHIFSYHWPDFNLADSAIVVGGILLMLDAFRGSREEGR
jgi:signal peptidase II